MFSTTRVFPLAWGLLCLSFLGACNSPASSPKAQEAPGHSSRLTRSLSPYLRQHADNLVDWYPWGDEAFATAKAQQKPIFLSVGYSTCHWCHVMERESFMNPEVAAMLNRDFISIKVDREERPDVDRHYMQFVIQTTGQGGWPMSVFLTPNREAFLGGTYFAPHGDEDRAGLLELLPKIRELWQQRRSDLVASAQAMQDRLQEVSPGKATHHKPWKTPLDTAYRQYAAAYDAQWGGFSTAPKFPQPVNLSFLLRYSLMNPDSQALPMVVFSLQKMSQGGLHDALGGGFHRYSTDQRWQVPHFEKMLYDQALLAQVYLDTYALTGEPSLASSARDILDFVQRELTSPEGGFYSALDADSEVPSPVHPGEHAEGAYYVWQKSEISKVLDAADAELFCYRYGVEDRGNASSDPSGELPGKNVLFEAHSMEDCSKNFSMSRSQVEAKLNQIRKALLDQRSQRPRPALDEKIVTCWNAPMLAAFAQASRQLGDTAYLRVAQRNVEYLERALIDQELNVKHHALDGVASPHGFNEDYAEMISAYLELFAATQDPSYLARAFLLQDKQLNLFWDSQQGAFFETVGGDFALKRSKEYHDGATWSSNSRSALNLLRLSELSSDGAYHQPAERVLSDLSPILDRSPRAMPGLLCALDAWLVPFQQIVIATPTNEPPEALRWARQSYTPHRNVIWLDGGSYQNQISAFLPYLASVRPVEGRVTVSLCRDSRCEKPSIDDRLIRSMLQSERSDGPR